MRIGLLGPIDGEEAFIEPVGQFCLDELGVTRLIYLGRDGVFEEAVRQWAIRLVGSTPEDSALWRRSLACLSAAPATIADFVARERRRQSLSRLQSLTGSGIHLQTLGSQRVLMCHRRQELATADLTAADIVAMGNERTYRVAKVDERYYLCPGSLSSGGVMVLEDDDGIRLRLYDKHCQLVSQHRLRSARRRPAGVDSNQ